MTLGENIRRKRLEYDLTQLELAKRIGVSKAMIGYYEQGIKLPSIPSLIKLADTLHCSVDELLDRKAS